MYVVGKKRKNKKRKSALQGGIQEVNLPNFDIQLPVPLLEAL